MAARAIRKSQVSSLKSEVKAPRSDGPKKSPLELDRLIHERLRLGIVSALAVNDRLSFNDLKALLQTTDGNLSVHARKLEEADYIVCDKGFEGRVPRTEFRLTAPGRRALEKYLAHMEAIIRATKG
ncbi:MAG TPA: transcriptional regulator [Vicinamibacterales bacterium]|nr:transcriptional regulator [Vicinamibacterales bacterium]